jgi:hypothetical protein
MRQLGRARATTVTVRADPATAILWEVEEDDYGDLIVMHRHPNAVVPAYIIGRGPERLVAQCSECQQFAQIDTPQAQTPIG